jgi:4-hydroxybenzoyl-CoA thioesterase
MIPYDRLIAFDEVDSAGVVFFGRYTSFAHEAVENFFSSLEGGYPGLIRKRGIGLPIVHLDADFRVPLRYGDKLRVETSCAKLGSSSATFVHEMYNAQSSELCTTLRMIVVSVELAAFRSCPMPEDVRQLLADHLVDTSDQIC